MMRSFSVELKVPTDASFAPLLGAFLRDACERSGLPAEKGNDLIAGANSVFSGIVAQDRSDSAGAVRVVATCAAEQLSVAFLERAILPNVHGIERVDEVQHRLHGVAGSEIRLSMRRPHEAHTHGAHNKEAPQRDARVEAAPEQAYSIRRFRPEDAEGVARAFYLTYGYHYPLSAVYMPDRLRELNASGRYVSVVAESAFGEIVAHYALRRDEGTPIAEGGGAIVVPAHRGRDLLNRVRAQAEAEARDLALAAYYTEPVTDHGRTQRASMSFGAVACGITLGAAPRDALARHMELSTTTQRQTLMLYFKPLRPRASRVIFSPSRHRAIVERIYAELGLGADVQAGFGSRRRAHVSTSIDRGDDTATITVEQTGTGDAELVAQAANDLRTARKLGAVYAKLPLEDAGTPQMCEHLERLGFFFSGVGPWMLEGRDALRLQLPLTPLDLSELTVVGELGRDLLGYVASERERCSA